MVLDIKGLLPKNWFCSIGSYTESKYIKANSLEEAAKYWTSPIYEEACSIAWEGFRSQIHPKFKNTWTSLFSDYKNCLIKSLNESKEALRIVNACNQSISDFICLLPHLGAIGESLTNNSKLNFFLNQIDLYNRGYWVCGWNGIIYNDKYTYPDISYIVY
jgi:hypothetical protein